MSRERDQVLGHSAEADGIEEYDNPLPTWWVGLFVVTIVFGVVYAIDYHFVSGRSQAGEYDEEMAAVRAAMPPPAPVAVADAAGREIFQTNCVGCHGADLHGGVGPNLTDAEWIHGGRLEDITRVITQGVPEKGMITWGPVLGPEKVGQVAKFVHGAGGGL